MSRRKEPIDPREVGLSKKITENVTHWDCMNMYPGIDWELTTTGEQNGTGRDLGNCEHYDDSEILRQQEDE